MLLRERERALFTDRTEILAAMHRNAELLQQGRGVNLALVGQRRVGKRMIVQRFADDLHERPSSLVPVYFDVASNLAVPTLLTGRPRPSSAASNCRITCSRRRPSLDCSSSLPVIPST